MSSLAVRAVRLFEGDPSALELVPYVENEVWRFRRDGDTAYLRLGAAIPNALERTRAELAWVSHLHEAGLLVAPPLPSTRGDFVEPLNGQLACAFESAKGRLPDYDARVAAVPSRDWTREHRIEIGATVGPLHRLSAGWSPPNGCDRRHWVEDASLSTALPDELERERAEVLAWMNDLPEEAFGLVHADLLPGNWMLHDGRLEVFDFDDSHRSWLAYDLAVPLYVFTHAPVIVRSVGPTPHLLDDLLEGYEREWPMDPTWQARIRGFVRFRRMLVLADAHRHGRTDTP